jgi:protocatechuate 3,4-dioxygenase beta subunit
MDIWHANSQGLYSDIQQAGTEGEVSSWIPSVDDNGTVRYDNISGWAKGRTSIYTSSRRGRPKSLRLTSQLYFNDSITNEVHTQDPYSHHGFPDTRNSQTVFTGPSLDGPVQANSGTRLMLNLNKDNKEVSGIFDVLLDSGQQQPAQ